MTDGARTEATDVVFGPRTSARPMAFTAAELWRGAGIAWFVFAVELILTIAIIGLFSGHPLAVLSNSWMAIAVTLLAASIATVLGALIAWLIGRALQGVRRQIVHLCVHGVWGAVVGAVTVVIAFGVVFGKSDLSIWGELWWVLAAFAAGTAIAVDVGWWATMRLALKEDEFLRD